MTSLWMDQHSDALPPAPRTTAWRDGASYDVVVVGAGLTGLATAYLLARRGLSVGVVEARHVGAVTTGNTTGKVSLLQGTALSQIRDQAGEEAARTYVDANRAGQEWLIEELGEGQTLQRRDAWTYAVTDVGRHRVTVEWEACREAGLAVEAADLGSTGLPYPTLAALRLPDQAQVHAGRMLFHLVQAVLDAGGEVIEGVRVVGVDASLPGAVRTDHGPVLAGQVVVASGFPVLDRNLHFARLTHNRSYGSAYRVPGPLPSGMYLSADPLSRSLRTAPIGEEELLIVGGNGHPVGRPDSRGMSPRELVHDLDSWARKHFPGAERTHRWSAQDYRSTDGIPYVGPVAGSGDRIYVATGYDKWGMTNGTAAALALAGHIVGDPPGWAGLLAGRGLGLARAGQGARFNAQVGVRMVSGLLRAGTARLPSTPPPEGAGAVGRDGARPVGVCTVDGVTHRVSAVCTHLGGVLGWNDAELTWDCPLHGSRFTADGRVLEGPATSDLGHP